MKKSIFLVFILIIISCQNKKSGSAELNTETEIVKSQKLVLNDTITYLSRGNDLAIIKLTLIPNGTFDFYTEIFPNEMLDAKPESDIIKANGLWNGNEKTILLNFAKRKEDTLNLNSLFDSNYKGKDEIYKEGEGSKVIDQNTVEIDYTLNKLNIWSIVCDKTKK